MGGVKRQAYLLKNGDMQIQFVGFPPSKCTDKTLLFTASVDNFKAFPGETYHKGQISSISKAIEVATGTGIEKPKIEMFGKYDTFYDLPRIYTKVTFPEQFVSKISSILAEPRISIRGTYKVLEKQPDPRFRPRLAPVDYSCANPPIPGPSRTSGCLRPPPRPGANNRLGYLEQEVNIFLGMRGFANRQQQQPGLLYNDDIPCSIYVPVHDDPQDFSVEGILMKEQATYETFNGVEKMTEYYKRETYRYAQLKYAVILEWQDFGMDSPHFERNILGKLFDGKPLSDCIIVASLNGETREFECHRNILGVNSDVFLAMLGSGMQEAKTNRIVMEDVSGDAVELLLQFMYGRELDLDGRSEDVILDLMKTAHKYNVDELEKHLSQFLCSKPTDWFTMNGALGFYFFTVNVESFHILSEKLRGIMKMNTQQLSACSTYQEWMEKEPRDAAQFVLKLLEPQQPQLPPAVANAVEIAGGGGGEVQVVDVDDSDDDIDEVRGFINRLFPNGH